MKMSCFRASILTALLLSTRQASADPIALMNGDFETGDFTGWTLFTTEFGGIGSPAVVPFDTDGDSTATNSARLNVGQIGGPCGIGAICPAQGGGILQSFSTGTGQLFVDIDIAAQSEGNNGAGGLFVVLIDGTPLTLFDFGDIGPSVSGTIERAHLSAGVAVSTGSHQLHILIMRAGGETTFVNDYIDNVALNLTPAPTAVPEPTTLLLMGTGLGAMHRLRRSRRLQASGSEDKTV